jgi:hypothetical protein
MSERNVTFDMICRAVCAVTGLTRAEMMAPQRSTAAVRARFTAWWLATKLTTLSQAAMGRMSAGREHTSVIAGVARAEELRATDPEFRMATDALLATLHALEAEGMLRLAEKADPIAAARRVLAAPEREAVRVSVTEIVAMSRLIVEQADGEPSQPSTEETEHV